MDLDAQRMTFTPGDGLLVRLPGIVVLALAGDPAVVEGIVALCREVSAASASAPARTLARRVATSLAGLEAEHGLALAIVSQAEEGVGVLIVGEMEVEARSGAQSVRLTGRDAATWVDRILAGRITAISLGPVSGPRADEEGRYELDRGVVPAVAAALVERAAARQPDMPRPVPRRTTVAAAASPDRGVRADVADPPTAAMPLTGGLPEVEEEPVPPTPIGTIVFEDGATYVLDGDYVVGREPEADPAVVAGRARPLRLDDNERSISRVHAELRVSAGGLAVVDRGSTNGTYVWSDDANDWVRLEADREAPVAPGGWVAVGSRSFTFEPRPDAARRDGSDA